MSHWWAVQCTLHDIVQQQEQVGQLRSASEASDLAGQRGQQSRFLPYTTFCRISSFLPDNFYPGLDKNWWRNDKLSAKGLISATFELAWL